jgi:hypothetical protein
MTIIKKFPYTTVLGWSISRYDMFQTCKRRYFYAYYAKYDEEFKLEQINLLKNMTSIPLEIGNIVHDIQKKILQRLQKTTKNLDIARLDAYCLELTKNYCHQKVFAEVYYQQVEQIDVMSVFAQVRQCVHNFLQSPRLQWLIEVATERSDEWLIEPDGYGETRIGDLKAYCKVDFLFPVDEDYFILDWKTGKPDLIKHKNQLIGYAAWAYYHFAAATPQIKPIICYLTPDYVELPVIITAADVVNFTDKVQAETTDMYQYCAFVTENIPKPKSVFTCTEQLALCGYCNFRQLCNR